MKIGPVEKIYEALSAIADDRVKFITEEGCLMPTAQGVAKLHHPMVRRHIPSHGKGKTIPPMTMLPTGKVMPDIR